MAIAIRFNTVIIAKRTIDAKYPGGVDGFRADQWPFQLDYCEDSNLIAVLSMGDHASFLEELVAAGLVVEGGAELGDLAYADQGRGLDSKCRWLDSGICHQLPVCWLRDRPPSYVVDYPGRSFIRKAKWAPCAVCGTALGVAAAMSAVDACERAQGALGFIDYNRPNKREARYVVACRACSAETTLDKLGKPLGRWGSAAEPDRCT